ncbi:acetyl-CoA decarbonylase/synthase complex subunit alpha/beta [Methanotorris formicicus]|uniref:Acetyl-CoA decarbonylase/synthase complex subunit beta n=1 Tax=Methanotorris formicicus Mc-S-70 TaxID=647171 RepID=H1L0V7_9EURY|nr:acetyl-CoA decarbonylase/synthase complex subunit alpha/beta [Methanotorris formicicus]EHP84376.1 CO dehydrogenase/acetyl-CoA synthase complex, beta subunit [Methanotorris formicicus Mc-S-70]
MVVENIIEGAKKVLNLTKDALKDVENREVGYKGTNYNLPLIYGLLGKKIKDINELRELINSLEIKDDKTLENALDAGVVTLLCAEALEALKYATEETPYKEPYVGFIPDETLRGLGVPLVEGKIPAILVVIGKVGDEEKLRKLIDDIRKRNILALFVGEIVKEMDEAGIEYGLDKLLVPLGDGITSAVHAANLAIRAPLIFGGIEPGKAEEIIDYITNRVPGVVVALGDVDDITLAAGAGCIKAGVPVITNNPVPVIEGALESSDIENIVENALKMKGVEVKVAEFDIPVSVGPMNEGERVRGPDMQVELAGPKSYGCELVVVKDDVEDGIEVIGKELDEIDEGSRNPFAIVVEVNGKGLEKDIEGVLERRVHEFLNYIEGVMHLNQRDQVWVRINKNSFNKGLRLKHIAEVVKALFKEHFPIIEKCKVKIITDEEKVKEILEEARKIYADRDARARELSEEDVDVFYGCVMCQSFAPTHVCIITPDRPSLCGSISYFDARAAAKIDPEGPIFEVPKGELLDEKLGIYSGVNEVVESRSQGSVKEVAMHSALTSPCTSCGCFEAIAFYIPEVDGFGVVDRNFKGETPFGLPFSSLAGQCSGGKQVPGFVGIAIEYMRSPKFLQGDGGWQRVVWLPKELKEKVKDAIPEDLYDKIATEEDVSNTEELAKFLEEKGHPVMKKVEETEEEKIEESKEVKEEEKGIEIGETILDIAKERGIQIIMKNVKIVINFNVRR